MVDTRRSAGIKRSTLPASDPPPDDQTSANKRARTAKEKPHTKSIQDDQNDAQLCTPATQELCQANQVTKEEVAQPMMYPSQQAVVSLRNQTAENARPGAVAVAALYRNSLMQPLPVASTQKSARMGETWGKMLSLCNQHVNLFGPTFTIGSSSGCNLQLKDQRIGANLCKLKFMQGS